MAQGSGHRSVVEDESSGIPDKAKNNRNVATAGRQSEKMGPVAYFSLCLLCCLIFNPSLEGIGATSCRRGWLYYQGHCYAFFPEKVSWLDAEDKHWRWTDGSLYRYSAWNAEEPNNKYDEYCVELVNHTGKQAAQRHTH
ncbi:lactate dehydrogenase [Platysternon megacephalum]|uniref:Lactate dehydrogenase n=1 Tax=Platysternon megacephalum TaxID=55544 RepID=A0A4D9DGT5_9SAUR|nr:lactate dehydrogenase [Platysternon megacephalum]